MNSDTQNPFSFIAEYDGDEESIYKVSFDENLPLMPLRDIALFPGVILPIAVGRISSIRVCKEAYETGSFIVCASQLVPEQNNPGINDLSEDRHLIRSEPLRRLPVPHLLLRPQ